MITLYTFGPNFGLPDPSPFVVKAMLLLKFAGLDYREDSGGFRKAPKGKLPYLDDDGVKVADSTFIRFHIETKYGFDFDAGLSAEQKGACWALERMCDDHLYWAMIHFRWMDDANFDKGPANFFNAVPWPLRGFVKRTVRRQLAKTLHGHGLGRHSKDQIAGLAARDIEAIANMLGDKPFLMGEKPCGADATAFGFVSGCLTPFFDTPLAGAVQRHPKLVAYCDRMMSRYFPDFPRR